MAVLVTFWWSTTAFAQLDPLLFIKRVPPTVIVVFDTSMRMLEDGSGIFYDPNFYVTSSDPAVMASFPAINTATTKTYRRAYRNLQVVAAPGKYTADIIGATAQVWDPANALTSNNAADQAFLDPTRYNIAKSGLAAAINENSSSTFRWGLIKLRQNTPAWRTGANCDKPVLVSDLTQSSRKDTTPCNASLLLNGYYAIYSPSVAAANYAQAVAPAGTVVVTPAANTASTITTILARGPNDNAGLVPAGVPGGQRRRDVYLDSQRGHDGVVVPLGYRERRDQTRADCRRRSQASGGRRRVAPGDCHQQRWRLPQRDDGIRSDGSR